MDTLLKLITSVAIVLSTGLLLPWLKTKLDADSYAHINNIIQGLVEAADQSIGMGNGGSKLDYVVDALKKKGYDPAKYLPEIESAVLKMHANGKGFADAHGVVIDFDFDDDEDDTDEDEPTETEAE